MVVKELFGGQHVIVLLAIGDAEKCADRYRLLFTDVWITIPNDVRLILMECWCCQEITEEAKYQFALSVFSFSYAKQCAAMLGKNVEINELAYGCFRGLGNLQLNHDHLHSCADSEVRYVIAHELCHCYLAASMGEENYAAMPISVRELRVDEMVTTWNLPNVTKP